MNIKKLALTILIVLVAGVGLISFDEDQQNFEIAKNLDIYYTLFNQLNTFYVDPINPDKLVKESIDDMLSSLDPYTNYISEDEMEDFRFMTTGEYAGIGALISKQNGKIVVAEPYEGYPAQKSGLRAGDIILEVAGKSTDNMDTQDVSNLLKGPAHKPVDIKVQRPGMKKPFDVQVVREKITINPVPYYGMLNKSTGYIRLTSFTETASAEVKKALLDLKSKYHPASLVLDLRSNPGGLLFDAVNIVNLFVPKGEEIVSTRGKVKQWDKTYYATSQPVDTTIQLAVLVNQNSASASEIVSGAIQDLDRGVIIGTRTYGKGLVQTTRDLTYNTKLKVTTAKYYIPSGRCIQILDYSHRNPDGSVGSIPDSLISEFNTKHGRKVFDGGGIAPDVYIAPEKLSELSYNLTNKYMIFNYATKFANTHDSIPQPEDFKITDDIYNDFIAYVTNKDFDYESTAEQTYNKLVDVAKKEKLYASAENDLEALKKDLTPHISTELQKFKPEISELLKDEIVSRYYYQKGAIRASVKDDSVVNKALQVLGNQNIYAGYFKPGTVIKIN